MSNDVLNMREFDQRFRQVFQEAPFAAALVSGPYFTIEMANDACLKLWNRDDTILGMHLLDAIPEIKDQVVFHILQDVYRSGEIFEGKEQEAFLVEDSTSRKLYVNFTYKPIKDDDQKIDGILIIGYDVTDQVINRQKLQESEERTRLAIQAAGLGTFDKDYVSGLTFTSQNLARMFGFEKPVSLEEYISRIHPDDLPIREAALADALTSGQLFYEVRVVIPDRPVRWVRVNGTILFDDANNPIRMIGTAFDISEEKLLKESEARFRILITETPEVGVGLFVGPDLKIQYVNDVMLQFWGKDQTVIGKTIHDALPELEGQPFFDQIKNVYTTGIAFSGQEVKASLNVRGELRSRYFTYTYKALRDIRGEIFAIHHMAIDVTDQVKTKLKLIENEEHVRRLFQQTPIGIGVFRGEELIIEMINDAMLRYWGRTYEEVINRPLWDVMPEVETNDLRKIAPEVFKSGLPYSSPETPVHILRNGKMETIYLYFAVEPIKDEDGKVASTLAIVNEITELVNARKKVEKNEMRLQHLADAMPQVVWIAEGDGTINYYNNRVNEFAGIQKTGDTWTREVTLHPEDIEATDEAWLAAVQNVSEYEVEHRVLMKDGSYRWHLSRAYPYRTDEGIKWYGTATDVHDQKVLEMNLESLVRERTMELERSNEDLQQFAHVASHDLKEPLRKIKTFIHQLNEEYRHLLGDRGNRYVGKIMHSTDRMYAMINGVLNYASAAAEHNVFEPVDINKIISSILMDLEILIHEKNATITAVNLPVIRGLPELIHQLFYNLINNSLKFSKSNVPAVIDISCKEITIEGKEFFQLIVSDNGIGFEDDYAEQIFVTFFRLHSKDKYEGTGLGLALCKKIVEQHGGFITAKGNKDGAQFIILLPKPAEVGSERERISYQPH